MTAKANYKRLTCTRCTEEFTYPRKVKYCSSACRDGTTMTREEWRAHVNKDAQGNFECEHCGINAYRKLSGTSGSKNRFCSMPCRVGNALAVRVATQRLVVGQIGLFSDLAAS